MDRPTTKRKTDTHVHTLFNPPSTAPSPDMAQWRIALNQIVFEADSTAGRLFDIGLLACILLGVLAVMLESVASLNIRYGDTIRVVEWSLTILFTVEYFLRLICVRRPLGYSLSFFGIVDLLSVIPTYLSLIFAGAQALAVIRVLRLFRVFRLFKLPQFVGQAEMMVSALTASFAKITVFLISVSTLVILMGSTLYLLEGAKSGFTSIPRSIYWAIVTLTTVGYGDIAPQTPAGQAIAAVVMLTGYAIIAVPTGIVTAELVRVQVDKLKTAPCACDCDSLQHSEDAKFCRKCGAKLGQKLADPG